MSNLAQIRMASESMVKTEAQGKQIDTLKPSPEHMEALEGPAGIPITRPQNYKLVKRRGQRKDNGRITEG